MSSIIYNTYKAKDGNDWAAGADSAYKVMLVTNSYTPDPDHTSPSATGLASNEVAGGSYARQNCGNRSKAVDNATNVFNHLADNPTFPLLAGPAQPRYAVVYRVVTNDSDHQLVACIDVGAGLSIAGDFMVKWGAGATNGVVFKGG